MGELNSNDTTERLLNAQAELQLALAFLKQDEDPRRIEIEMRVTAGLAMLHSLMGDLGLPMYQPAQMPEGWYPA